MMPARGGISLAALSALSAGFGFAIWFALTWARIGTFEYPLDDVYIQLAMAEGIAGGTYGINPGEPASAASSILYPLLLTPFAGTDFQRLLPLAWNSAGLLTLGWLLGRWIEEWSTGTVAVFLDLAHGGVFRAFGMAVALASAAYFLWMNATVYNWMARGVYLQHAQVARIEAQLPGVPVAVNDIGRVAWEQDAPVVDLCGLAYADARRARQEADGGPVLGWAGAMAEAKGARYEMVYADWFKDGIGTDWQLVATLTTLAPIGILGSEVVSIYAIDPTMEDDLRAVIERLAPSMPAGATLTEMN